MRLRLPEGAGGQENEVGSGELEAKRMKLDRALRNQSSSPELLHFVQKQNSLVDEEAELMTTVQELRLEEKHL